MLGLILNIYLNSFDVPIDSRQSYWVSSPIVLNLPTKCLIEISEHGADLEYSSDGLNWKPISLPATRLGLHLEFEKRASEKIWIRAAVVPKAEVIVASFCGSSPYSDSTWWADLQAIAETQDYSSAANKSALKRLEQLRRSAKTHIHRSYLLHVLANHQYLNNDYKTAELTYELSAKNWKVLGFNAMPLT